MAELVTSKLNIVLHENQQKIVDSTARFKVVKAGKRFGKSLLAVYIILRWAGKKPNGKFWYIAPTYGNAKDIAWDAIKWMLPENMVERYYESDLTVLLKNGAKIILKGSDKPETLRGVALDGVVMDEMAYQLPDIWQRIIYGQLIKSGGPAFFISSPNEKGKNHFSGFWDQAKSRMESGDNEWASFYYTIWDNPTLPKAEIQKLKDSMSDFMWDLEYMAKESAFAGIIFSEFDLQKNVGEYTGDKILTHYRGMDWGIDHPSVCLWASLDLEQKRLYITDEYVKSGQVIRDICSSVKGKTGDKPIEWTVLDPSMFKRDKMQAGKKEADEFARWGVTCIPADNRDRGYDIVNMFLKYGILVISPKCKSLLYAIQNVQWGDTTGDDETDALRYLCVRVNDFVYGMNIHGLNNEAMPKFEKNELNFNDPCLFPDRDKKEESKNWVMEELEVA